MIVHQQDAVMPADGIGVEHDVTIMPAENHGAGKSMSEGTLLIEGVRVPRILYGTAWKEDETQRLTELALRQGFRGIDTANQRRHYDEAAVGQGIAASIR